MLTISAFLRLALERCLAFVTDHACTLSDGLFDILRLAPDCSHPFLALRLLCLLVGVARAFLAEFMVTIVADLLNGKLGLAAVACTVHPHANLLLDTRYIGFECRCPLANFESHVVFREQSANFFLLEFGMLRSSQN